MESDAFVGEIDKNQDEMDEEISNEFVDLFQSLPDEICAILEELEIKSQETVEEFTSKIQDIFAAGGQKVMSPKRKRNPILKASRELLKEWLDDNKHNPYPTEEQKLDLEKKTGLSRLQLDNWMVNGRKRYLSMKKTPPSVRGKLELKSELESKFLEDQEENGEKSEEEDDEEESEESEPSNH